MDKNQIETRGTFVVTNSTFQNFNQPMVFHVRCFDDVVFPPRECWITSKI